jgi:hypothetical protein
LIYLHPLQCKFNAELFGRERRRYLASPLQHKNNNEIMFLGYFELTGELAEPQTTDRQTDIQTLAATVAD